MLPLYLVLFQGFFSDIDLILKIVGLLFIISFVRNHIPNPLVSTLLILGLSVFLLFDFWSIFGSALFLYILVSFGVVGILVDLGFLGGFSKEGKQHEMQEREMQEREMQEREMQERQRYPEEYYEQERETPQYGGAMEEMPEAEFGGHGSHGNKNHPSLTRDLTRAALSKMSHKGKRK